ncbi:hypothetical protein GO988_16760 [Hymenobacter sp. HMF4947]|uniref:Uncharacterized protein n=1 Tax=Hymenobacter ginkgonis TaxID=2682976 RepID=A0A7K1THZ6_9BACT|nr:hypothetical protein [Hymenobacter ginkgonis]MVN77983.1 hypothetical protein [Hymenobacter ginkgonis]
MKNLLLLAFLAGATAVEAAPLAPVSTTHVNQDQTPDKKDLKRQRKLRKQTGPEVYKGTVANQNRIINDAPGANKDDDGDDSPRKSKRSKKQ